MWTPRDQTSSNCKVWGIVIYSSSTRQLVLVLTCVYNNHSIRLTIGIIVTKIFDYAAPECSVYDTKLHPLIELTIPAGFIHEHGS